MHTVYSDEHYHQDGNVELFEGKVVKPHEIPRRAEIVLERVKAEKLGDVVAPRDFGLDPILAVHDRGFDGAIGGKKKGQRDGLNR